MLNERQIEPPSSDEYFEYYHRYISRAPQQFFLSDFGRQSQELRETLARLPEAEVSRLHAEFSWTLKQVIGHLIDVERLFSTRMLRIAAGDVTPIPGYEQDDYVANLDYQQVSLEMLLEEFDCLRRANVLLVSRLSDEALRRRGTASGHTVSARANLFILAGHFVHHLEIIQRRIALVRRAGSPA
ncbi:MAG: DinB family protein [Pirellulales bacterium]